MNDTCRLIDRHYTHYIVSVVVVVVVLACALWFAVLFNDSPLLQRPPHHNDMAKGERGLQMQLLLDT